VSCGPWDSPADWKVKCAIETECIVFVVRNFDGFSGSRAIQKFGNRKTA
jgi:hypothetical protein